MEQVNGAGHQIVTLSRVMQVADFHQAGQEDFTGKHDAIRDSNGGVIVGFGQTVLQTLDFAFKVKFAEVHLDLQFQSASAP